MKNTIKVKGEILGLNQPIVMGILNITPDSFYKDSRFNPASEDFFKKATEMVDEDVDIFDIGGYSTRPGSAEVSEKEEIQRVVPAIDMLKKNFPTVPVSIDTFRAQVAIEAIDAGADIVNDISAGDFDMNMLPLIIERNIPYVIMHKLGNLQNMHTSNSYNDFLPNLINELFRKANLLRQKGVKDIIIDPGFGFSKNIAQNYEILKSLELLNSEHYPILIGISRKSMIYKTLDITPGESLPYSQFLNGLACMKGGSILRVHDVKATKRILQLTKAIYS